MRLQLSFLIMAMVAIQSPRLQAEPAEGILAMPEVQQLPPGTVAGRKVIRCEHGSAEAWGYATPQRDYFYVELPKDPPSGKAPLRVVLHSAGGGAQSEMGPNIATNRAHVIQAYVGEDSYGLWVDCRDNRPVDWWWGYHSMMNMPGRYKTELCPTENRILATVQWVLRTFPIDPNRVYLSGISMGGSGSLGLGMNHGNIFAAISVDVPAHPDHALYRLGNSKHPDPPPVFNFSSQNDGWSKGQEQLIADCQTNRYAMAFAWGPFGHTYDASKFNAAVYESPWLAIRKDEAYPVFTCAATDNTYPGFGNLQAPDQQGQINGYFRWKNLTDTTDKFAMELRLVKKTELKKPLEVPGLAVTDVTLRRLQHFHIQPGKTYQWQMATDKQRPIQSGTVLADADGLLTIRKLKITDTPGQLQIEPN